MPRVLILLAISICILVALPASAFAVGTIGGVIRDQNGDLCPVAVPVSVWQNNGFGVWTLDATVNSTAGTGAYTITPTAAGSYALSFNVSGASVAPNWAPSVGAYLPQWYNNQPTPDLAATFVVAATGATTGINATLASLEVDATDPTTYVQGDTLTASWSTTRVVAGGDFGVWVQVGAGTKYLTTVVPAAGASSWEIDLTLNVPAAAGYQTWVGYRTNSASTWTTINGDPLAGTFTVTAGGFVTSVSAPASGSFNAGGTVNVKWTTSTPIAAAATGKFGVWVRSSIGVWTPLGAAGNTTINGNGSTSTNYSYDVSLASATPGTGFQAIVAFSPTGGGAAATDWTCFGTSPGSFAVTTPAITVSTPASAVNTGSVIVNWSTPSWVTGDFGVWLRSMSGVSLRSMGGIWYPTNVSSTQPALSGVTGTSFTYGLPLTSDPVPPGSYQAIVAYRPDTVVKRANAAHARTIGSAWTSWGTSAPFTVTGAVTLATTVTAPTGGTYTTADDVTVDWTINKSVPTFATAFRVWVRSGDGSTWYGPLAVTSTLGVLTYPADFDLSASGPVAVPVGTGYQAIVCYSATGAAPWSAWGTSAAFNVTSR